jgi:hypothetical protein
MRSPRRFRKNFGVAIAPLPEIVLASLRGSTVAEKSRLDRRDAADTQ